MVAYYRNPDKTQYGLRGAEKPSVLLFAEGPTEAYFLSKWLELTGRDPETVAVVCFKGISNLKTVFRSLIEEENFNKVNGIGFFIDADTNSATSRADSITAFFKELNLIPKSRGQLTLGGLNVIDQLGISIFVSPDNNGPGCIENIVMNEISTTKYSSCIQGLSKCVNEIDAQIVHAKTLVQAYLGIVKPGRCGTGHGFNSGDLDVMNDSYKSIRESFERLIQHSAV